MKTSFYFLTAAAVLNVVSWFWVELAVPRDIFLVLVSYNIFWPHDILGERVMIFAAPLLAAVIFVINALLVVMLKRAGHEFFSVLLAAATFGLQLISLVSVWFVIQVNV